MRVIMKIKIIYSLLAVIFLCRYSHAEDIDLEKIVVTPLRAEEDLSQVPANATVITKKQIENSAAKSIPEFLNTQKALIMRDYYGNGKNVNADMRGFGDTGLSNVLVLIDGRRVNNVDLSGTDWTQIPLSSVEKIEILRGPSSVMYGDNASAGVINILTKEPEMDKQEVKIGALLGSYEAYGETGQVSVSKGNFAALGMFDQFRTNGYRVNSKLLRNDTNAKLLYYAFDKKAKFGFSFGRHKDKYGLPSGLKDGELNTRDRRSSVSPDDHATTGDLFTEFNGNFDLEKFGRMEFSFARRKRDTFANFVRYSWMTERNTITYTFNPKYLLEADFFRHKNKLIAGIDYFNAEQDINDGAYSGNPDKLTLSKKNLGFYFNNQFYLTEKFSLSGGMRHERAKYNFEQEAVLQDSEKKIFKQNVYSMTANCSYSENSNIYLSFARSFRHPLLDEIFVSKYDFGFGPGGGLNTGLTPQTSNNYEMGIRHAINKNFSLSLSGYFMKFKNEIYYEPSTGNNTNYDSTIHRGLESGADLKIKKNIRLFANYIFTDAFFLGDPYDKKKIPEVPVHKWVAGSDIKLNRYLNLLITGNFTGERYFTSDQPNSLPRMASYFTLDTKLTFTKGNILLYFAINNLFDEEYYEYGAANFNRTIKNYYPAAERNFTIGGSFSF